jgi:hypothetical protein
LEMLWLRVAVVHISSLLMDGWNMSTSPDVLQWWSPSPAVAAFAANLLFRVGSYFYSVLYFVLLCAFICLFFCMSCWWSTVIKGYSSSLAFLLDLILVPGSMFVGLICKCQPRHKIPMWGNDQQPWCNTQIF